MTQLIATECDHHWSNLPVFKSEAFGCPENAPLLRLASHPPKRKTTKDLESSSLACSSATGLISGYFRYHHWLRIQASADRRNDRGEPFERKTIQGVPLTKARIGGERRQLCARFASARGEAVDRGKHKDRRRTPLTYG